MRRCRLRGGWPARVAANREGGALSARGRSPRSASWAGRRGRGGGGSGGWPGGGRGGGPGPGLRWTCRRGCGPGRSGLPTAPGSLLLLVVAPAAGELAEPGEVDLGAGAGLFVVGGGDQAEVVDAGSGRRGAGGLRDGAVHVPAGE